jgi:hypothetical protein
MGQGGLAVLASSQKLTDLRAIFDRTKFYEERKMGKQRHERTQSGHAGQTHVVVKMTTGHFMSIPSRFAQTIADNLHRVGLDGNYSGNIKDISGRNVGRGKIRAVRIEDNGAKGKCVLICVEPDISNSLSNRFDTYLYCPDNHPAEEVVERLQAVEIEPAADTPADQPPALLAPPENPSPEPASEFRYPDLTDQDHGDELCCILQTIAAKPYNGTIEAPELTKLVVEVCSLQDRPERVIGRQVIGRISRDDDGEETILVKIRREAGSIRAYSLGKFALAILGHPAPCTKEPALPTPEPAAETKATLTKSTDPLGEIGTLMALSREYELSNSDCCKLIDLRNFANETLAGITDSDRRTRIELSLTELFDTIAAELQAHEKLSERAILAKQTLDEIRKLLG